MKYSMLFPLIVWVSCALLWVSAQEPSEDSALIDSLSSELERIGRSGSINGFGVALVNENGVVYSRGFGQADVAAGKAYDSQTLQNIGSVSKTLIGLALIKASEMEYLNLDDPVNRHLPFPIANPWHPDTPITIRQLATHTSSIRDTEYYDKKAYVLLKPLEASESPADIGETLNPPEDHISILEFVKKTLQPEGEWYKKQGFLKVPPGTKFEYSNVGATLAAVVLEQATGMPYNEFTALYVLDPLGMDGSGWFFEDIDIGLHSRLYTAKGERLPFYRLNTYPDGGLITSPEDLGKYLHELIRGKSGKGILLTPSGYEELFRMQLRPEQLPDYDEDFAFDDEYNSGIFMGFTPSGYIGHIGGDPGIVTFLFFHPESRIGRLLMINTSIDDLEQFGQIWTTLGRYEEKLGAYRD